MSLEEITRQTLNTKPSLFQRIRNSLAGKLAFLLAAGTFASANCNLEIPLRKIHYQQLCYSDHNCPGQQACIDNLCIDSNQSPKETHQDSNHSPDQETPSITKDYLGSIPIKSGITNQNGQIFFIDEQTGEPVTVNVEDESNNPLPHVYLTFFDGNGFETFQADLSGFTPFFHIFAHNSIKTLTLTSTSMQFHHYNSSTNDNSKEAAKRFSDWTKVVSGHYLECISAEEAKFRVERGNHLFDLGESLPLGIGEVISLTKKTLDNYYDVIDKLIEWGILEGGECAAFQKWYFVPPATEDNNNLRAALWYWECLPSIPPENCNDQIDNDCDRKIDYEDNDCVDCTPQHHQTCYEGSIWWFDSCDNPGEVYDYCSPNEYCEDAQCKLQEPVCTPTTEICDNKDNNCDGNTDENLTQICYSACGEGIETCIAGFWSNCNAPQASTEICDSIDNDCDGQTDEDNVCGPTCQDECDYEGQKECGAGQSINICTDKDSDGCLEWDYHDTCEWYEYCQNGACLECEYEGQITCTMQGGWGYKICGDHDDDGNLEWGDFIPCPPDADSACIGGECTSTPPPPECAADSDCEPDQKCEYGECVSETTSCSYEIIENGNSSQCSPGCEVFHYIGWCTQIECTTSCDTHSDCPTNQGFYCDPSNYCTIDSSSCGNCCDYTSKTKQPIYDSVTGEECGEACQ